MNCLADKAKELTESYRPLTKEELCKLGESLSDSYKNHEFTDKEKESIAYFMANSVIKEG